MRLFNRFRGLYQTDVIIREIPWRSPYAAFAPLDGVPHAHLLHGGERRGDGWSIIVAEPREVLTLSDGDAEGWLDEVARIGKARRSECRLPLDAPFASGMVGYVGYEALARLEPALSPPASPYALPDAQFGVYDAAALLSRHEQRVFISARSKDAANGLESVLGLDEPEPGMTPAFGDLASNFSSAAYEAAVADVIERIRNGDFFQANIAQTLRARSRASFSPLALLRRIAEESDAFFAALFQYEDGAIVSNSPERFFSLDAGGRVLSEPIKGTRPRGNDSPEDRTLADELLSDPKDRAENVMIADLVRNDLSRICENYSIREEAICELMSLSRVHHLVSRIAGRLREECYVGDVFRALFPAGSITGAPKIEAMKAIGEIERQGRGPYCGAFGYIDDSRRADFAVAIRTMIIDAARREISIPVGGGVTLRSNPAAEYQETLVKASAALAALGLSAEAS